MRSAIQLADSVFRVPARSDAGVRARCRRRLRRQERAVSRMGHAALGGAAAWPAGEMDRATAPRISSPPRRAATMSRARGWRWMRDGRFLALDVSHDRQSRRLYVGRRAGQFHQCAGQRHGQRLRHSGDLHGRAGRVHQHRADRCLSRRRQARGELHDRAADRRSRAPIRLRSDRAAPAQPGRDVSLPQGAWHGGRLRPLRRQPGRCRSLLRTTPVSPARRAASANSAACCAASASPASWKPRAARRTRAPKCVSATTARGAAGRHAIATGMGHETAYPQIAADLLGLPIGAFRYMQADTSGGARRQWPWRRAVDAHGRRGAVQGDATR